MDRNSFLHFRLRQWCLLSARLNNLIAKDDERLDYMVVLERSQEAPPFIFQSPQLLTSFLLAAVVSFCGLLFQQSLICKIRGTFC